MLNYAVPIALATVAQMFVMTCNDIDLSIGAFVGFVCCVAATYLGQQPLTGMAILAVCIAAYAALGALIEPRSLPSIVVTLGMSFVWQGLAILLLPQPGGRAPAWLQAIMGAKPPYVPLPIVAAALIAAVAWFGLMRTSYGAILRGAGGNRTAIARAGWSMLRAAGDAVRARRDVRRPVRRWRSSASPARPTRISATAIRCSPSPASFSAAASSSAASSRRSAR